MSPRGRHDTHQPARRVSCAPCSPRSRQERRDPARACSQCARDRCPSRNPATDMAPIAPYDARYGDAVQPTRLVIRPAPPAITPSHRAVRRSVPRRSVPPPPPLAIPPRASHGAIVDGCPATRCFAPPQRHRADETHRLVSAATLFASAPRHVPPSAAPRDLATRSHRAILS